MLNLKIIILFTLSLPFLNLSSLSPLFISTLRLSFFSLLFQTPHSLSFSLSSFSSLWFTLSIASFFMSHSLSFFLFFVSHSFHFSLSLRLCSGGGVGLMVEMLWVVGQVGYGFWWVMQWWVLVYGVVVSYDSGVTLGSVSFVVYLNFDMGMWWWWMLMVMIKVVVIDSWWVWWLLWFLFFLGYRGLICGRRERRARHCYEVRVIMIKRVKWIKKWIVFIVMRKIINRMLDEL